MKTIGERMDWARRQKGKSFNDLALLIGGTNANALGTAFRRNTIKDQDLTNGNITCHSFNSFYKDYNISLKDVYKLYQVRKIVERRVKI